MEAIGLLSHIKPMLISKDRGLTLMGIVKDKVTLIKKVSDLNIWTS